MTTIELDPSIAVKLAAAGGAGCRVRADGKVSAVLLSQAEHEQRYKQL